MDLDLRPSDEWLADYWPLLVGAAIIVVGNVYLYGVLRREWVPAGPPVGAAIVVVLLIEIGRAVYARLG